MRTLSIGDTGDDVQNWQHYLASQGYAVTVDGKFGPETLQATRAMQKKFGLKPDGKVGHRTIDKADVPTPRARPTSAPMPFAPAVPAVVAPPDASYDKQTQGDLPAMHAAASNRAAEQAMAQELMGQYYDTRQADAVNQTDAPPPQPGFASDATATMPGLLMAGQSARGIAPNFAAADDTAPPLDVGAMGGGPQGAGLSAGTPVDPVKRDALIRALLMQAGG